MNEPTYWWNLTLPMPHIDGPSDGALRCTGCYYLVLSLSHFDVANVNEQGYTVKFLRLSVVEWPSELKRRSPGGFLMYSIQVSFPESQR